MPSIGETALNLFIARIEGRPQSFQLQFKKQPVLLSTLLRDFLFFQLRYGEAVEPRIVSIKSCTDVFTTEFKTSNHVADYIQWVSESSSSYDEIGRESLVQCFVLHDTLLNEFKPLATSSFIPILRNSVFIDMDVFIFRGLIQGYKSSTPAYTMATVKLLNDLLETTQCLQQISEVLTTIEKNTWEFLGANSATLNESSIISAVFHAFKSRGFEPHPGGLKPWFEFITYVLSPILISEAFVLSQYHTREKFLYIFESMLAKSDISFADHTLISNALIETQLLLATNNGESGIDGILPDDQLIAYFDWIKIVESNTKLLPLVGICLMDDCLMIEETTAEGTDEEGEIDDEDGEIVEALDYPSLSKWFSNINGNNFGDNPLMLQGIMADLQNQNCASERELKEAKKFVVEWTELSLRMPHHFFLASLKSILIANYPCKQKKILDYSCAKFMKLHRWASTPLFCEILAIDFDIIDESLLSQPPYYAIQEIVFNSDFEMLVILQTDVLGSLKMRILSELSIFGKQMTKKQSFQRNILNMPCPNQLIVLIMLLESSSQTVMDKFTLELIDSITPNGPEEYLFLCLNQLSFNYRRTTVSLGSRFYTCALNLILSGMESKNLLVQKLIGTPRFETWVVYTIDNSEPVDQTSLFFRICRIPGRLIYKVCLGFYSGHYIDFVLIASGNVDVYTHGGTLLHLI